MPCVRVLTRPGKEGSLQEFCALNCFTWNHPKSGNRGVSSVPRETLYSHGIPMRRVLSASFCWYQLVVAVFHVERVAVDLRLLLD